MTTLALEFSSTHRSAAVLVRGPSGERPGVACEATTRHTPAFSLVESALAAAGVKRSEIEVIVVGLGPGSSTGIRAAIAIAEGWQLATGVRVLGSSSLAPLATQLHAAGRRGRIHLIVDAQRREFHAATYELQPAGPRAVEPLRIESAAAVEGWIRIGEPVLGPDVAALLPGSDDAWPEALALARLAAGRTDFAAPETLEPAHLRGLTFVKAPAARAWPAPGEPGPAGRGGDIGTSFPQD